MKIYVRVPNKTNKIVFTWFLSQPIILPIYNEKFEMQQRKN